MSNNSRSGLAERAKALIQHQPYFRGANYPLKFESFGQVLLITGTLPSFYLKQVLQTELLRLDGVVRIDNQVQVDHAQLGS